MNTDSFKQGQTDYLSFMGPPEGVAPSIPNYVNSQVKPSLEGNIVGSFIELYLYLPTPLQLYLII